MAARSLEKAKEVYSRGAPWISLGLGTLSRIFSHRGIDFAPKAVALLALAWMVPLAAARWLRSPADPQTEPRWRRWARTISPTVTVFLYKNVLFFLVPVWFGSAHFGSLNMLPALALAAMALFTCFSQQYQDVVLDRPRIRVAWTAVVLFAALVPAAAVVAMTSPRVSIIVSGFLAATLAWAVLAPRDALFTLRGLFRLARVSVPAALLLGLAAPIFPPVPMVCHARGTGIGIDRRELVGPMSSFPRGTARVFAWFAVTLPDRYSQPITFQWYRDGEKVARPIHTSVTGGRKAGFRTWTTITAPAPGSWHVDLLTDSNQLIGRSSFKVTE
jgi:hypothetical protein